METPMFDIPKWFKNANVDLPCGVIKQLAMEVSGEIIDCAASAMCSAALRKNPSGSHGFAMENCHENSNM